MMNDIEHVVVAIDDTATTVALELDPCKSHGDPVVIDEQLSKIDGIREVDVDTARPAGSGTFASSITILMDVDTVWYDAVEEKVRTTLIRVLDRNIEFHDFAAMRIVG